MAESGAVGSANTSGGNESLAHVSDEDSQDSGRQSDKNDGSKQVEQNNNDVRDNEPLVIISEENLSKENGLESEVDVRQNDVKQEDNNNELNGTDDHGSSSKDVTNDSSLESNSTTSCFSSHALPIVTVSASS